MPIPKPRSGDTQDKFIARCMRFLAEEGSSMSDNQRAAACYDSWRKKDDEQDIFGGSSLGISYKEVPHPESVLAGEYPEFDGPPEGTKIPKSTDFYDEFDRTEKS